jgi:hypothetical protein
VLKCTLFAHKNNKNILISHIYIYKKYIEASSLENFEYVGYLNNEPSGSSDFSEHVPFRHLSMNLGSSKTKDKKC